MKILLVSDRFFPSIGGVETVTRLLAEALVQLGHSVSVVTRQEGPEEGKFKFRVTRRPRPISLLRQYASADAVILQGPMLRLGWPIFLRRGKALMVHHARSVANDEGMKGGLRAKCFARVTHAAVSQALAHELPCSANLVLPNPYDDTLFGLDHQIARTRDVIFVGRLIPEKGAHILLEALAILRPGGVPLAATVVGDGPERERLVRLSTALELGPHVEFAGQVTGKSLAQLLQRHRLMVVPSLCDEAFGVAALEGIACGCAIIGSETGGLPEAIGPCGTTFPSGDVQALVARIQSVLGSAAMLPKFLTGAKRHLAAHHPKAVAKQYLDIIENLRRPDSVVRFGTCASS